MFPFHENVPGQIRMNLFKGKSGPPTARMRGAAVFSMMISLLFFFEIMMSATRSLQYRIDKGSSAVSYQTKFWLWPGGPLSIMVSITEASIATAVFSFDFSTVSWVAIIRTESCMPLQGPSMPPSFENVHRQFSAIMDR